jgi:hypothetical protein
MKDFFKSLLPIVFGGIVAFATEQSVAAGLLILTALVYIWTRTIADALDRIEAKIDR